MNVPNLLTSDRLILRRHLLKDLSRFAGFMVDPKATAYMAFTPEQRTHAGARQLLENVIASYDAEQPVFSLTVADPSSDAYLGSCGLQALDSGHGVEVFYTVLPEFQSQGLATEAVRRLTTYVFEEAGEHRIVAHVVPENVPSVRVIEKLGFVDDGTTIWLEQSGEIPHEALSARRYVLER